MSKLPTAPSKAEGLFALHCKLQKLPKPEREHKFHATRRWRFDFAWPVQMVAAEIEGGVWTGGRHTTGTGYTDDCEKYNHAVALGWKVFRFTTEMVRNEDAIQFIAEALSKGAK